MDDEAIRTSHIRLTRALFLFLASIILVSIFAQVDVASLAVGRIIPDGQVKAVQSFETGRVAAIAVSDGARVQAGEVLIRLDPAEAQADAQRIATDLAVARVELARLKATLDNDNGAKFQPPEDTPPYLVEASERLMRNQLRELATAIAETDADIRQNEATIAATKALLQKYQSVLPILEERVRMKSELLSKEVVAKLVFLEDQEKLLTMQGDIAIQQSKLVEVEAALASLREKRENLILKFRSDRLGELVEIQRKMLTLSQESAKAEERLKRHTLMAPAAGTVQDTTIHTVGGVISSGDRLMTIVPQDTRLMIEAFVSNSDIGFIVPGQKAEIKITTFDYRRYGIVTGKVLSVSRDAIQITGESNSNAMALRSTAQAVAELSRLYPTLQAGPVFRAEISLDQDEMLIDGQQTRLGAGMVIEANILTSRRRIIDYFLAPFQTYQDQAFRQR